MAERNRLVSATARVLQTRHGVSDPLTASQLAQTALASRSRGRDTHVGSTHGRRSNVAGGHVRFQPLVDRCEEDHVETMLCDPLKKYRYSNSFV